MTFGENDDDHCSCDLLRRTLRYWIEHESMPYADFLRKHGYERLADIESPLNRAIRVLAKQFPSTTTGSDPQ